MSGGPDDPLEYLLAYTATYPEDHFIALYAYGSFARGEADGWSDFDVALIYHSGEEARHSMRDWSGHLMERFQCLKIDPTGIPVDQLGEKGYWGFAPFIVGLLNGGKLLSGADIRSRMAFPTEHRLKLAVCCSASVYVRRLYAISRAEPLPDTLAAPDIAHREARVFGNAAWETATTVMQLLRAILFLETGFFCEGKRLIYRAWERAGDKDLASFAKDILLLRRESPRFAPLETIPRRLSRIAQAVPVLKERLWQDMARHGLEDPEYEPEGQSLYEVDGTPRY